MIRKRVMKFVTESELKYVVQTSMINFEKSVFLFFCDGQQSKSGEVAIKLLTT